MQECANKGSSTAAGPGPSASINNRCAMERTTALVDRTKAPAHAVNSPAVTFELNFI